MSSGSGTLDVTIQERVRQFILEDFYVRDPGDLADEDSLIDSGVVDSTGMMAVILFLEGEYGVHVEDREASPENLDSIARIARYVERKLESSHV